MPSGEEHPRGKRPRPHPARPGRIDPPVDQRGDGEGEGDRAADIAEIEERRMDREPDVLQHRVEVVALDRRRHRAAANGLDVNRMKSEEGGSDPALHREHQRLEPVRQVAAEGRDQRTEQRQDQDPEEHRALVVPPHAGDLVEERLRRVGVLGDVEHREVGERRRRRSAPRRRCRRAGTA